MATVTAGVEATFNYKHPVVFPETSAAQAPSVPATNPTLQA